jgi:hypothetical protein
VLVVASVALLIMARQAGDGAARGDHEVHVKAGVVGGQGGAGAAFLDLEEQIRVIGHVDHAQGGGCAVDAASPASRAARRRYAAGNAAGCARCTSDSTRPLMVCEVPARMTAIADHDCRAVAGGHGVGTELPRVGRSVSVLYGPQPAGVSAFAIFGPQLKKAPKGLMGSAQRPECFDFDEDAAPLSGVAAFHVFELAFLDQRRLFDHFGRFCLLIFPVEFFLDLHQICLFAGGLVHHAGNACAKVSVLVVNVRCADLQASVLAN